MKESKVWKTQIQKGVKNGDKQKGTGWIIAILILAIVGLTGYIVYDKVLKDTDVSAEKEVVDNTVKEDENVEEEDNSIQQEDGESKEDNDTVQENSQITSCSNAKFYVGTANGENYYLTLIEQERTSVSQKSSGKKYTAQKFILDKESYIYHENTSGNFIIADNQITLIVVDNFGVSLPNIGEAYNADNSGTSRVTLSYSEEQISIGNFTFYRK